MHTLRYVALSMSSGISQRQLLNLSSKSGQSNQSSWSQPGYNISCLIILSEKLDHYSTSCYWIKFKSNIQNLTKIFTENTFLRILTYFSFFQEVSKVNSSLTIHIKSAWSFFCFKLFCWIFIYYLFHVDITSCRDKLLNFQQKPYC